MLTSLGNTNSTCFIIGVLLVKGWYSKILSAHRKETRQKGNVLKLFENGVLYVAAALPHLEIIS